MPRDLESEKVRPEWQARTRRRADAPQMTLAGLPPLTKSPAQDNASVDDKDPGDKLMHDMQKGRQRDELHPLVQTLNPSYIDDCVKLENAAFAEGQRGSREKFIYRLTICGELCLGLFTTSESAPGHVATVSTSHIVESGAPERKEFLLAMVSATKTRNEFVSDDDMNVPSNWRDQPYPSNASVGHQEDGRTIAIHSLAVEPEVQGRGLGKTLLKAYIQRMQTSGVADRISILTYERLVSFYESVGFVNRGPSKVEYGGGGWVNMVSPFDPSVNRPARC
ncbi:Polyamine N-acetyltransferase 1 [Diplodia seriata]|uniref:Polyamine N-acetyltransferase 1 n=1 Tax=Diplodia seriata TaxID=420778 RepID=A0A1S8BJ01_9PEZI|nr:Polyamine N-acetyltransferase 1 [Diplodia seriata]